MVNPIDALGQGTRLMVKEPAIVLTEKETAVFKVIMDTIHHFQLNTVPRAAGGWVRDKLLGKESDDIDIAVDDMSGETFAYKVKDFLATTSPNASCSSVGVVRANPDQSKHLETATLRVLDISLDVNNLRTETYTQDSRIPVVALGTPQEDASRRDFTINALFYNLRTASVEDFTGKGLDDLRAGIIRTPLEPTITFQDDPLRILRAVRFSTRLGFRLDDGIVKAASDPNIYGLLLTKVSRERWGVEVHKMLVRRPTSLDSLEMLASLGIINVLTTVGDSARFDEPDEVPKDQGPIVQALVHRLREVESDHPLTDDQHFALTLAILTSGVYGLHVREKPTKPPRCACYGVLRHGLKLPNAEAERASAISEVASRLSKASQDELDNPVFVGHFMRYLKDDWVVAVCLAECLAPVSERQRFVDCRQKALQSGLVGCWNWRAPVNGASLAKDFGMPRGEGLSVLLEKQVDRLLSNCSMVVKDEQEFRSWLQTEVDEWVAANPEAVARANKGGKAKKAKK
ncbi:CCA tRNA nucleotidyltransferase, mitochondrial [Perkinsus olseni]|uniref:CCA tRNA nucleotidyltransferase, mitochondrial n=1 Tax=Perkinsus olseni TaxID=32597 RepID=A0A7J6MBX7_PEROL|nr:CCA tRNA nucleotidyltransferase, mitochondrial [Perkinsus olseni]KAF4669093.1 CCA tRNA nucleotidyltransferase, mitochondrial [Perkinsus olseni]